MKKPLRYMLSVMLMLALMLSMGTAAFADKTDSELPVEYVTYGVGLPDAPGVDRHELGDDDISKLDSVKACGYHIADKSGGLKRNTVWDLCHIKVNIGDLEILGKHTIPLG